jgi:hypothetical protein
MAKLPVRGAAQKQQTKKSAQPAAKKAAPKTRQSRTPAILAVFEQHAGEAVSLETLMAVTGFPQEVVRNVVSDMRNRNNLPITTIVRGQLWRYDPPRKTRAPEAEPVAAPLVQHEARAFVEVGVMKDGTIVAQHASKLYRVEEL